MMKELAAALMFFTRLPLWRFVKVSDEAFKHVVDWWPAIGLLTGGVSATVFHFTSQFAPLSLAIIATIVTRLFLTGCLHEDGLADFFDGFGGGTSRERTLAIMKDSHIGTYGVMSLIIYFATLFFSIMALPVWEVPIILLTADVWGKFCSSFIVTLLPYARTAETAKARVVYEPARWGIKGVMFAIAFVLFWLSPGRCCYIIVIPPIVCALLFTLMKKKIGGYTGDCCGATFLLSELSFLVASTL